MQTTLRIGNGFDESHCTVEEENEWNTRDGNQSRAARVALQTRSVAVVGAVEGQHQAGRKQKNKKGLP